MQLGSHDHLVLIETDHGLVAMPVQHVGKPVFSLMATATSGQPRHFQAWLMPELAVEGSVYSVGMDEVRVGAPCPRRAARQARCSLFGET